MKTWNFIVVLFWLWFVSGLDFLSVLYWKAWKGEMDQ